MFFSGPLEPNWKTLLHCLYRLIKSVVWNYSIENHKRFPKHTEPHWIKVKTKILDIFLSDKLPLCLCYFSKLVISFTLTHQSFYLSKEQNNKHLIFLKVGSTVKARSGFQNHHIGSLINILSGFVWKSPEISSHL